MTKRQRIIEATREGLNPLQITKRHPDISLRHAQVVIANERRAGNLPRPGERRPAELSMSYSVKFPLTMYDAICKEALRNKRSIQQTVFHLLKASLAPLGYDIPEPRDYRRRYPDEEE